VCPLREITPVPCTPPFVAGIINVRGQIVPVIDLKRFFDLPQGGITDLNKVLIMRNDDLEVGFLADAISGGRRLDMESLQASLPTLTGIRADYLRGVTGDRLVVLDAERILSDKKIIVDDQPEA
jgi:purine-binding chemotaxis protein CheW